MQSLRSLRQPLQGKMQQGYKSEREKKQVRRVNAFLLNTIVPPENEKTLFHLCAMQSFEPIFHADTTQVSASIVSMVSMEAAACCPH